MVERKSKRSGSKTMRTTSRKSGSKTVKKTVKKINNKTIVPNKKQSGGKTKRGSKILDVETVDVVDTEERIREIRIELLENYARQKQLTEELECLLKIKPCKMDDLHTEQVQTCVNFGTVGPIPHYLRKVLKIEENEISKYQLTQRLYEYLVEREEIDKKTRKINPNKRLRRALTMGKNDELNFYNLQSWIQRAYDNDQ